MNTKALVVGNGPSVKLMNPCDYRDRYRWIIGCNHSFQQWDYLDAYVMADERNVIYAKEKKPEFIDKFWTKTNWSTKHKMQMVPSPNGPAEISGTLGIRLAHYFGATECDCVGFDSMITNNWDKAYKDVPWEKRSPRSGDRWRQVLDKAIADTALKMTVRLHQNFEDLQFN